MAHAFVLNCGSSSIKSAIIDTQTGQRMIEILAERLGQPNSDLVFKYQGQKYQQRVASGSYADTFNQIYQFLLEHHLLDQLVVVGHRVVHGGCDFNQPALIDQDVMHLIEKNRPLAPLHNGANKAGIEFCQKLLPELPQIAVFDTAFHQSMPKTSYQYAIDQTLAQDYQIRKYGFHGTSHQYITQTFSQRHEIDYPNIIVAHLGNGCSVTAVKDGQSYDTSMGFTPLDGLVMGTRSGTIDPGVFGYVAQQLGWDSQKMTTVLNKESGLLGLCGDNDMRDIEARVEKGDVAASDALALFCQRIASYVASYWRYYERFDGLVFTGGIGENSPVVRQQVIQALLNLGLALDQSANDAMIKQPAGLINANGSPRIDVIPTDEENMIAQLSIKLVKSVE